MALPPLNIGNDSSGADRRITTILRNYWEYLRDDMSFPAENEVDPKAIAEIWESCFLVVANNLSKKEDYVYKYIGKKIIEAYGEDLTGLTVDSMVAPQAGHLAEEYEKVLSSKRAVFDEGEISGAGGKQVKYRQILLPLGKDGVNITAILGGMSYKVFE